MYEDRRKLLDKLLRELVRSEIQAIEHPPRESRRLGETPPVLALRDVAAHAAAMQPRLVRVLDGHDLTAKPAGIAALTTLRQFVVERMHDVERAYRATLLELRHGLEVVRVLRDVSRLEELFALIRWCDDWLLVRRTLVSRVEAQLPWFTEQPELPLPPDPHEAHGESP